MYLTSLLLLLLFSLFYIVPVPHINLGIHRRNPPSSLSDRAALMTGLLTVFKCKIKDEEVTKACSDLLLRVVDSHPPPSTSTSNSSSLNHTDSRSLFLNSITQSQFQSHSLPSSRKGYSMSSTNQMGPVNLQGKPVLTIAEYRNEEGKSWEYEALHLAVRALDHICSGSTNSLLPKRPMSPPKEEVNPKVSDVGCVLNSSSNRIIQIVPNTIKNSLSWSKHTPKSISSLLLLLELILFSSKLITELKLYEEVRNVLHSLLLIMPGKNSDLSRRMERLLSKINSFTSLSTTTSTSTSIVSAINTIPQGPMIGNDEPTPPIAPTTTINATAITATAPCSTSNSGATNTSNSSTSTHTNTATANIVPSSTATVTTTLTATVIPSSQSSPFFPSLSSRSVIGSRPSSKEYSISAATPSSTITSTSNQTSTSTASAGTKISSAGEIFSDQIFQILHLYVQFLFSRIV